MRIGIDLGGSHIAIGVINNDNGIIKRYEKYFSDEEKLNIINVIENFMFEKIEEIIKENEEIEKISVAVPGIVKDGVIIKLVNLGIENYNISEKLYNLLEKNNVKVEIVVHNDVKCAAIAEYKRMVDANEILDDANMLFLGIGTGIGGAYIYNGRLLKGNNYEGTEFGHIVIKENGIQCKCGKKGCFERYGSILEFKNKVKKRLDIDSNVNGEQLRDIINARLDEIVDIKEEYINDLAIGISNLINIFEPDCIVLGGGFVHFSYMFMDELKNMLLNSNLLFNKREDIDIRIAKLGNDAAIIGGGFLEKM